jgi:hypothetical protein
MSTGATPPDLTIQAAQVPSGVRVAGGFVLGAGVLSLLLGIQVWTGFQVPTSVRPLIHAVVTLGASAAVSGASLLRGRLWAAIAGLAASSLLALASAAWLYASFTGGLLSLFALACPAVAVFGTLAAALSIAPCRKIAAARERLRAEGLDLGT